MKKLIALLIVVIFLFVVAACASDRDTDDTSSGSRSALRSITQSSVDPESTEHESDDVRSDPPPTKTPDKAEEDLSPDEVSGISDNIGANENSSSVESVEDEYIQYLSEEPSELAEFLLEEGELDDFVTVNTESRTQAIREAVINFAKDGDAHRRALERAKEIISQVPEALPEMNISKEDALRLKDEYIRRLSEDSRKLAEFLLERDELREFVEYTSESRSQIIEKATEVFARNEDIRQKALERAKEIIARIPITRNDLEYGAYELRDRYSQLFQRMADSLKQSRR